MLLNLHGKTLLETKTKAQIVESILSFVIACNCKVNYLSAF